MSNTKCKYSLFPISDQLSWDYYQKQKRCFWTIEEITQLDNDARDFQNNDKFSDEQRHFILTVLAFFACADAIVNEELFNHIINHPRWGQEANAFYKAQMFIETVHNEAYNILIETLCSSKPELAEKKHIYFNGVDSFPVIANKKDWFQKSMERYSDRLGHMLFIQACVEGVHFSSSFACIFYFKKLNLLPGTVATNQFIIRDEALHRDFALLQLARLPVAGSGSADCQLTIEEAHNILKEAVDLELDFVGECLQSHLLGINSDTMKEYVKFVANDLMKSIQFPVLYPDAVNPFPWMESISLQNKTNFFEHNATEYAMPVLQTDELSFDEVF